MLSPIDMFSYPYNNVNENPINRPPSVYDDVEEEKELAMSGMLLMMMTTMMIKMMMPNGLANHSFYFKFNL